MGPRDPLANRAVSVSTRASDSALPKHGVAALEWLWDWWRRKPQSTALRSASVAFGAVNLAIVLGTVSIHGVAYLNLNSLLLHPGQFYLTAVIPAGLGAACLLASVLPRTLTINCLVFLGLLAAADGAAWCLQPEPELRGEPEATPASSEFYQRDVVLGHALVPNTIARHRGFLGSSKIYDVTYEIDALGRRSTPTPDASGRTRFALFFGDSNMFGYGLHQAETIPAYVAALTRDYRAYNYGVPGYGPVHMLELAARRPLGREIREREGVAVFFFIPGHVARVIGASEILEYGHDYPYYVLGPAGALIAKGNFTVNRPFTTLLYYLWTRSNVVRRLEVGLPLWYSEADYLLTAKVFEHAAAALKQKLPVRDLFIVLGQAYSDQEMKIAARMRTALARQHVATLDYTQLFDPNEEEYHLPDMHNSAPANCAIAAQMVADLHLAGPGPIDCLPETRRTP